MKINANIPAFITNKQLLRIEGNMATSMERLSSGLKLNHAKDNPAGMAISNKMRAQIAGLDRASNNASDAIAAIRIADGALNETSSIMQRMRELAVQAANDTNSLEDRQAIQAEIDALKAEVNRIARDTEYNEMPMLDGTLSARVYADHVDRISTTDAVKAGMYQVEVSKAATQAKVTSTTAVNPNNSTTEVGVSGTVDINGSKVDISAEDTYAEVYEKLRNAAEVGGATLEINNGNMEVTSEAYGKKGVVAMFFTDANLAAKLGFDAAAAPLNADTGLYEVKPSIGTEPEIKLVRGTDKSEFSNTATIATDGNRVTITDSGDFRMSFLLDAGFDAVSDTAATDKGLIELEVTDIGTMTVHIGANENQNMVISVPEISSESLYIDDIDVTKIGGASEAISRMDEAIKAVSSARSKLGAYENRLDYSVTSLDAFEENMTEAQSRLADTDMAQEMTTYTQQNVLNQAAISVLTQANDMPQQVLQLLQ